jgi:GT2 family glycosyltransferase
MRAMPAAAHNPPTLSISLVLYQSDLALLERTLARLDEAVARARDAGVLAGARLEVVDNASPGDYAERARALVTRVLGEGAALGAGFHRAALNRGYGAGHNSVLLQAASDLHLVLNPDVELAGDALATGIGYLAAEPAVVLLAPAARGPSGAVEYLCKRHPSALVLLVRASGQDWLRRLFRSRIDHYELRELDAAAGPVEVPLVSGCCMLMRTAAVQAAGGFDEAYFLYFEDFDLSLRLARRGRVLFHPAVRIVHHGGYAARKGWRHVRLFLAGARRFFGQHGWRWL